MLKTTRTALGLLLLSAAASHAAPIPVTTLDGPTVSGAAILDVVPGFGATAFETSSLTSDPFGAETLTLFAELAGEDMTGAGDLVLAGGGTTTYLNGALTDVGSVFDPAGNDRLEFQFSINGGDAAAAFGGPGGAVLASFTGDLDNGGTTDLSTDGVFFAPTAFELRQVADVSAIPLPATLPMLIAGLGGLALWHRRT